MSTVVIDDSTVYSYNPRVTTLIWMKKYLDRRTLELFPNVKSFYCLHLRIHGWDNIATLKNLEELVVINCFLTTLEPISDLQNLETLVVNDNQITSIACLGKLKNLKRLNCTENPISDVDLLKEMNLELLKSD